MDRRRTDRGRTSRVAKHVRLGSHGATRGMLSVDTMLAGAFSDDIAIDLGTANTLVHVVGRGVIIDEPSVVAVLARGGRRDVLAVGAEAKALHARRPPERIELVRPLRDGVIADFIATEAMLRQFIGRTRSMLGFRRPRILICVPAGATPVERRAVYETAVSAGGRRVYIIEEPVAAALGAGLPVEGPKAFMVVDIGGGTTDIAVLSAGNVMQARSLKVAGNAMDEAIMRYVRRRHQLVIGETNAERIKIEAGTALAPPPDGPQVEIHIKGRDLRHGHTKEVILTPRDLAEALTLPVAEMAEFICRALEDLPPQVAADVIGHPIILTGGGAQLSRLDAALHEKVGVTFAVPATPMHCVIRGSAAVLESLELCEHLLIGP